MQNDPDKYIYEEMRKGCDKNLPAEIAAGLDTAKPDLLERRKAWNTSAGPNYALRTETWREVVARRQRYQEVKSKLASGEVAHIHDMITHNLDIRRFAENVIGSCGDPELLRTFWEAIQKVSVLDPTCGSGAFLFAALNILQPLYEKCLERMEWFVGQADAVFPSPSGRGPTSGSIARGVREFDDFRAVLAHIHTHGNENYFVIQSIVVNNLYGVDIMEEAVDICKLRLFLKLAAQLRSDEPIEPLPDIDFNIRAGNALVGFASLDEVRRSKELDEVAAIERDAQKCAQAFEDFRNNQYGPGGKKILRGCIEALNEKLNKYLASEYGVRVSKKSEYVAWLKKHQPFHWLSEFYGVMRSGGFDVIIGNPPYLEIRDVDYSVKNFACLDSGAIHAMCIERSAHLLHRKGCMSMIVPLSLPSTQRMQIVQELLEQDHHAWFANYAWRPAKLFDTVNRALTVFVVTPSQAGNSFASNYQKWTSDGRDGLFRRLNYVRVPRKRKACWIPKLGDALELGILEKCLGVKTAVKHFVSKSEHRVYYRTTGGLYWKVFTDFAPAFNLNGKKGRSSRETWFAMEKKAHVKPVIAALSSNVFWWWYTITSNVRDLNPCDIQNFPLPQSALDDHELLALSQRYMSDMDRNSVMLVREQKQTGRTETQSFKIQKSKTILNDIDRVLAKHYGFSADELDFIINYDIKYRMGGGDGVEGL